MPDVVVRLPEESQSFVEQQVAARQYASASDYIASLVEDARRRAAAERVDRLLVEGLASGPGEEATPQWWDKTKQEWKEGRTGTPRP